MLFGALLSTALALGLFYREQQKLNLITENERIEQERFPIIWETLKNGMTKDDVLLLLNRPTIILNSKGDAAEQNEKPILSQETIDKAVGKVLNYELWSYDKSPTLIDSNGKLVGHVIKFDTNGIIAEVSK